MGDKGKRQWGDLINVQYKSIRNCHNKFPLYKYILVKKEQKGQMFRKISLFYTLEVDFLTLGDRRKFIF
jgi:hypothetical protein